MQKPQPWFDRTFTFRYANDRFATVVERLRGTPARLEEKLTRISSDRQQIVPTAQGWTIKEQAGHLLKLEELWRGRMNDILQEATTLREADLDNRATSDAHFNSWQTDEILASFRLARESWTEALSALPPDLLDATALHPRLQVPMRVMDLAYFVAEHDDHHLATISWLDTVV